MSTKRLVFVWCLMLVAAAKTCLFAVRTPEFYLADELFHFDVLTHYSQLDVPRQSAKFSLESMRYISFAPPVNHEALEPPLYYVIGGVWHAVGEAVFGLDFAPRWDRMLSALFAAATVWIGFQVARRIFPSDGRQLLVPAFLAFIPQGDLCGINNDTLVPVCAGLLLLSVLRFRDEPGRAASLSVGLAVSALALTKTTALPLILVFCLGFLGLVAAQRRPARLFSFALGLLPLASWCVWNKCTIGDWTGAGVKMSLLGFTVKPISAWWEHELFTGRGAWLFWSELTTTFWRGELPLPDDPHRWDVAYVFVSTLVAALIIPVIWRDKGRSAHFGLWLCLSAFAASVVFLAVASVRTDFGPIKIPTHWLSFLGFSNGRLMSGALVPFSVLLAEALYPARWRRPHDAPAVGIPQA
jgi:hypothetical protein